MITTPARIYLKLGSSVTSPSCTLSHDTQRLSLVPVRLRKVRGRG